MKSDPLYDNRIVQVLQQFCARREHSDLREIISMKSNMIPAHVSRVTPGELLPYLEACKTLLQKEFPDAIVRGIFIARTIH